ncbi:MAG: Helix-turn-helix domain [Verrucomicrobiota bacterium]
MEGEGVSQDVREKVAVLAGETRIALQLAKLRQQSGITQEQMAERLSVGQSAISKLENGRDEDITIREIKEYSRATGQRVAIIAGKPFTHVEAVRLHAHGIRDNLEALAAVASQNVDLQKDIQAFFGEAFFNLLDIISVCNNKLPNGLDFDLKLEVLSERPSGTVSTMSAPSHPSGTRSGRILV